MKIKNLALAIITAVAAGGLAAAAETETNAPDPSAASAPSVPPAQPATNAPVIAEVADAAELTPTNAVRMNFHDVPLNTVLNYLSKRMGFVVVAESEVRGNTTIVSEQPIGTNEVVELLSGALAKNNYSVTRNGRVLTITTADAAKNGAETPVKQAASPDDIPINDQIATYILPVHTLNPTQLIKDLDPLIPPGATVAANEAGNAIIMTARQKDIHRFSEIINALDSSSVSDVEVFILRYADAKSVAAELKEVFQSPDSTVARSDSRQQFRGRGLGALFNGGGGDGGGNGSGTDTKNAANKAVFTSDDQMNAVVASAPPDFFPMITNVIEQLDQPSQDVTIMRLFPLKHIDPQEMADELSNLFPDETKSNDQNNRTMGLRFAPPWMQQQAPASGKSDRMTRQTLVRAVPDPRTHSLMVTTSSNLMEQIAGVIEALDKSTAGVQNVYVYQLINADPVTAQAALTGIFSGPNTKTQPQTSTTSALTQRVTTAAQQQTQSTTGFSSLGSGTPASH
jgi:type II secretory pathway component GspD/PulD (secretin)